MVTVQNKVDVGNIVFTINTLIYPLAVIMKTAYNYTDNFYIFLDYINDGIIEAQIKPKESVDIAELESLVGDFYNELLNQNIRLDIQKNTSNLRQLILGRALYTECIEIKENELTKDTQLDTTNVEISINEDYNSDLYQISAPWTSKMEYKGDD
jgi:His-Xaa-Ser system protein HxsD